MKMLSKLKNSFIDNVYNNRINWPRFKGVIQFLIGCAALIYCIFAINDRSILLMMLLFWVSFCFSSRNYENAAFYDGYNSALVLIRTMHKQKDNLNEKEKDITEDNEKIETE